MTHAANLPFHQYVSVDKKILSGNKAEDLLGLVS